MKKYILTAILMATILTVGCGINSKMHEDADETEQQTDKSIDTDGYGVYLSCEYNDLPKDLHQDVLVIDAQYYTEDEISELQENNGAVYSYINLGSIENFRDYFDEYSKYCLDPYENWDEEYWMDVTQKDWQDFIYGVAQNLADKGISGFFVDNVDVYYHYPTQEMFEAVATILESFKNLDMDVVINGGDIFVSKYLEEYGTLTPVLDGVNQETVFSSINWDTETFGTSDAEDREYFLDYLATVKADGKEVYLLEYTQDSSLMEEIKEQCAELGYHYYVSDSIELD
jgi:uncharacterized protein (TIGR01370 family)